MKIREFLKTHFKHFNAATLIDAAEAYIKELKYGHKMFLTMAGAMSTAELGISLAEMIRQDKVHAISCTAANLEEDLFNLIAHESYKRIPQYRELSPGEELTLFKNGYNRVTDTCIPEQEAIIHLEKIIFNYWKKADNDKLSFLPHQYFYQLIKDKALIPHYQTDPKNSWLLAAAEKKLPLFVPGWEDSSLGNAFVAKVRKGEISSFNCVKSGLEYMNDLIDFYKTTVADTKIGFFQIGGGIAGDFPICVVPLITQDLKEQTKLWSYFCQISDSTTSYGSYSGAVPNEKITWGKLGTDAPKFIIESDATIVTPLIFGYILDL